MRRFFRVPVFIARSPREVEVIKIKSPVKWEMRIVIMKIVRRVSFEIFR